MQNRLPSSHASLVTGTLPLSVVCPGSLSVSPPELSAVCFRSTFSVTVCIGRCSPADLFPSNPPGIDQVLSMERGNRRLENTQVTLPSPSVCRVRLVERGSPHSLPLMESGKVSIEGGKEDAFLCESESQRMSFNILRNVFHRIFSQKVFLNVIFQNWVWP